MRGQNSQTDSSSAVQNVELKNKWDKYGPVVSCKPELKCVVLNEAIGYKVILDIITF